MNVKRAAVVFEGVVVNTIVVEINEYDETDFTLDEHEVVVLADDSPVTFGWTYSDNEFSRPEEPEDIEE